jgi:DNA-binding beta-propeller fold protein YncE
MATMTFGVIAGNSAAAEAHKSYQLESALIIKSPNPPDWDYLSFDASRSYVYIARRKDGILMYDTVSGKIVGTLEGTADGNSTTLVPEFDRIYVTTEEGELVVVRLSTLKTLERIRVGKSADNTFYDPFTKQLLVTMGDDGLAAFVDAASGKLLATMKVDSASLEAAAPDGQGHFYLALRDRNKVIKIDIKEHSIVAEIKPDKCVLPNSLAYDLANQRLLVGCRGEHPELAVVDDAGHTLGTTTIGRGVDNLVFDAAARRVYTANGFDGTLVVLDQVDANSYKLAEAATTRPYARTMALDPISKKVYMVTAEGTVDTTRKWKADITPFYPNRYFLNTFTLLTYSQR